jgi:Zn-dependent protease with chaperone function
MGRMLGALATVALATVALAVSPAQAQKAKEEKVDGYAEWRTGDVLVVEGQRVRLGPDVKLKGKVSDPKAVPLGYEVKAKGVRQPDGSILARELEAKPNGSALFEKEVKKVTDQMEAKWLAAGRVYEEDGDGRRAVMGRLRESGPEVTRVRGIVEKLVPPYLQRDEFRVYVVDNKEWNAFACANGMVVVHSQLLDDMDDDELAIVLGHELAHVTHEHPRKQFKKAMWIQIAAVGVAAAAEEIDDRTSRQIVQLATVFAALAWKNGYGRDHEDQADRVGLRYAYEAGYDITKGPALWDRFARKYGEPGKVANFFFGDHSLSRARARKLERELALNYADARRWR